MNAPHKVSQKTRERVAAAVQALNWIPHGAAQALASLRTRTVGALIPNLGHQAIASMIETLQETLGEAGYTLLLGGGPGSSPERTIRQATTFIQHGVECLILMGEDQPKGLLELIAQRGVFYVVAYTSGRYGLKNCIGFDNFLEMARAEPSVGETVVDIEAIETIERLTTGLVIGHLPPHRQPARRQGRGVHGRHAAADQHPV